MVPEQSVFQLLYFLSCTPIEVFIVAFANGAGILLPGLLALVGCAIAHCGFLVGVISFGAAPVMVGAGIIRLVSPFPVLSRLLLPVGCVQQGSLDTSECQRVGRH